MPCWTSRKIYKNVSRPSWAHKRHSLEIEKLRQGARWGWNSHRMVVFEDWAGTLADSPKKIRAHQLRFSGELKLSHPSLQFHGLQVGVKDARMETNLTQHLLAFVPNRRQARQIYDLQCEHNLFCHYHSSMWSCPNNLGRECSAGLGYSEIRFQMQRPARHGQKKQAFQSVWQVCWQHQRFDFH